MLKININSMCLRGKLNSAYKEIVKKSFFRNWLNIKPYLAGLIFLI